MKRVELLAVLPLPRLVDGVLALNSKRDEIYLCVKEKRLLTQKPEAPIPAAISTHSAFSLEKRL
jgi:hypothetical protein